MKTEVDSHDAPDGTYCEECGDHVDVDEGAPDGAEVFCSCGASYTMSANTDGSWSLWRTETEEEGAELDFG